MIILILFIGAVLFATTMIFAQPSGRKTLLVTLGLVLTVGSAGAMILNYNQHLGLKRVTVTRHYPLASSQPKAGRVLLVKPLGTAGREPVYLYRTNPLAKQLTKTNPAKGSAKVIRNAAQTRLTVKTTTWVYRNEELRLLFDVGMPNHEFAGKQWQFELKSGWRVATLR
ncbi:hypothetical protein GCM10022296_08190 [Secundilactobacillus similis DSM 23365 = JCM 2765]|uniref:DUF4811 domain-containing protein n=1 Tax=Secundilactobacillus similis DSM 23365 = JCM 2765 TaxID=1423804 RepID=A0A0R2EXH7_9LACO|nr:DUF4811 domain-containing protein [Secundilactobacillus similis]KRN19979.1 hypothetical protein FD14_GL001610 [Secundilactobacillus similis DSM 23365 = JCM 2765]